MAQGAEPQGQRSRPTERTCAGSIHTLAASSSTQISRRTIDRITEVKLAEGVTNATVNRLLEVVRAILRKCVNQWEWLDRAPQVRMLKEPTRRVRFLTRDEARVACRVADAFGGYGGVLAGHGTAAGQRHRTCSGRRWIWCDVWRGFTLTRRKRGRRSRCRSMRKPWRSFAGRSGNMRRTCLAFAGSRFIKSARKLGSRRSNASVSRTFVGMIFGTPGRAGTCRTARRYSRCRNWEAGKVRRWCGATRTCRRSTWRRTRIDWAGCRLWRSEFTAQIRHSALNEKGLPQSTL